MSQNSQMKFLLSKDDEFPALDQALDENSDMPGLLAVGGDLSVERLKLAYLNGIFPWFSQGQPILWWSPNPRLVLFPETFKVQRSLKQSIKKFLNFGGEIKIDFKFRKIIENCASIKRIGQNGTWITPEIINAYCDFHKAGFSHSIEVWQNNEIIGGLYFVAIGKSVFGESMFALKTDASKIALAGLVALCRYLEIPQIDCQQTTNHLLSLGACEISRNKFLKNIKKLQNEKIEKINWQFNPEFWSLIF